MLGWENVIHETVAPVPLGVKKQEGLGGETLRDLSTGRTVIHQTRKRICSKVYCKEMRQVK